MESILYSEPHLAERIDAVKRYAAFIKAGKDVVSLDDAEMVLRHVISKHYNIPMFDEYFEKRTIDQLFFEVELIMPAKEITTGQISEAIKQNQSEIDAIADEEMEEWVEPQSNIPSVENDPIFLMAKEFMKTGKFLNENPNLGTNSNNQAKTQPEQPEEQDGDWK